MNTKQVLVWRNDLKVRKGKLAAQIAHASMAFLTKGMGCFACNDKFEFSSDGFKTEDAVEIKHWIENSFRKICCYVSSEEEMLDLYRKALDTGLTSHLIEDNGATEFNGVKTVTALAIGPHWDERFIGITDHLPLL